MADVGMADIGMADIEEGSMGVHGNYESFLSEQAFTAMFEFLEMP
jgi:hypothetical protein